MPARWSRSTQALRTSCGSVMLPWEGGQIAALGVYAGQAIADELLGDVRQPVAVALRCLVGGEGLLAAGLSERGPRPVGHPAGEFAVGVLVERAAGRVGGG